MEPPSPVPARPASTVIIARDAGPELEVLLAKRAPGLRFMANAHVFPGGALHAGDCDAALATRTQRAPRVWPGSTDPALDHGLAWAALRETLEEVGILLSLREAADPARVRELRAALHAGVPLASALAVLQSQLDLSQLVPFIRWVTPPSEPIRFDTRFYVAPAPPAQTLHPDGTETTAALWCSPQRAIAESDQRRMILSPPTRRTLLEIADVGSVAELLERVQQRPAFTVEPIIRTDPGGECTILYPGDPDHPIREPILRGATRTKWEQTPPSERAATARNDTTFKRDTETHKVS
jgi:8-oxo-dGTP pyrophosphatase MutT (NUDIX family)